MSLLDKVGNFLFGWLTPDVESSATGTELSKDITNEFIPKIYGKVVRHEGEVTFKATNEGTDKSIANELAHFIIVWGEACDSIETVYADGIDLASNSDYFVKNGDRYAFARSFPNGMDNYSDQYLTDAGWRATDTLSGKACTYVRLQYANGDNLLRSEPKFTADITGTSYSNPATALLDYLQNDIYGKGLPLSMIDTASFTAAATIADTQVEKVKDGGDFRDLFTINMAIDTGQTVFDNVNTILRSMRAMLPVSDGKLKLVIEKDDPAVSVPILEKDIIELGEITNSNKANRYSRVIVTYYDEDAEGTAQEAVYPEVGSQTETDWLAEDGQVLETTVTLDTCNNYYEALAFAKSYAEISREQLSTTILLDLWATIYEVGDIVNVTHSQAGQNGWSAKPFRITNIAEMDTEVELSVREHQPYIYDFENTGLKPTYPDTASPLVRPDAPANVTKLDVYNNLKQIDLTWTGTTTSYYVVVKNASAEIVFEQTVRRRLAELRNLAQANYTAEISAINSVGMISLPVTFSFAVDQEQVTYKWQVYAESDAGLNISEVDSTAKTHIGITFGQTKQQSNATAQEILDADYAFLAKSTGGTAGADGKSFARVAFYQRAATEPAKPADNSASFNFTTDVITPPAGWSISIPDGSDPLYVTETSFGITGGTGTDTTSTFSDVAKLAQDGADAPITKSYRTLLIRRRSASSLNTPTGGSYDFSNDVLTPPNLWVEGTPSGTDPIYESIGIASVDGSTGIDSVIAWSTPEILVENGVDGAGAFTLVNSANTEVTANTVTKISGSNNQWDAGAYSEQSYIACALSFRCGSSNTAVTAGISNNDGTSADRDTINYSLTCNNGTIRVYESGVNRGVFGSYTDTDTLSIISDAQSVKYYNNGVELYESTIAPSGASRFDCSINGDNDVIRNIAFTPSGQKGADGANGLQGDQGIQGEAGADGLTSYFHIAYADNATGTLNFNQSGGDYTGTYSDFIATDSTDPNDYNWNLTRGIQGSDGSQGIAGTNGENGQTSYLHIAYANSIDGTVDFSVGDPTGRAYTGTYVDFNVTDSTNPADYTWSETKGETAEQVVTLGQMFYGFESGLDSAVSGRNATLAASSNANSITATSTSTDFGIRLDPDNFNGKDGYILRVRVRALTRSRTGISSKVFYTTPTEGESSARDKSITTNLPLNEWVTLEYDMRELDSGDDHWIENTISTIRFDFDDSSPSVGDQYEIDYVSVGYFGTATDGEDGEDGEQGPPGADSPDAVFERDQGSFTWDSTAEEEVYDLPSLPTGNTYTLQASFVGNAEAYYFILNGEDVATRPSRVKVQLKKDGSNIGTTYYLPSSTGFSNSVSFNFSQTLTGQTGGSYSLHVDIDTDGSVDFISAFGVGYLQVEKV